MFTSEFQSSKDGFKDNQISPALGAVLCIDTWVRLILPHTMYTIIDSILQRRPLLGLSMTPNLKFLNFYHVMQLFGPAGPFSTVYLPLDQVVLGDNEQRVTFNSLFSLGVEDFRQLKQSSNPNPDENQAMKSSDEKSSDETAA